FSRDWSSDVCSSDLSQFIVRLRDRGRTKGIGADDIGASLEILLVNLSDDFRLHQGKQFVIPLHIASMVRKALAPEVALGQLVPLDHRSHSTVENDNAFAKPAHKLRAMGVGGNRIG